MLSESEVLCLPVECAVTRSARAKTSSMWPVRRCTPDASRPTTNRSGAVPAPGHSSDPEDRWPSVTFNATTRRRPTDEPRPRDAGFSERRRGVTRDSKWEVGVFVAVGIALAGVMIRVPGGLDPSDRVLLWVLMIGALVLKRRLHGGD